MNAHIYRYIMSAKNNNLQKNDLYYRKVVVSMFIVNSYSPVRVIFGSGRLEELATVKLPGKKALLCTTPDDVMKGFLKGILKLLEKNGVETVVYDEVVPNPTRASVMKAASICRENGCEFLIGLGGGSSIDTAKATSIMACNPGDLWDYATIGTGGKKPVEKSLPVVVISTTAGTGTECDCYCVITNEVTHEKLDFGIDSIYPAISIIDPDLMVKLPKHLTAFQGLDGLFHAVENYICNKNESKLVDLYASEAIRLITRWLPEAYQNGENIEARSNVAYATNVLEGFNQALTFVTSHHIIGQCLGGLFPKFPHGATLICFAEAYYTKLKEFIPEVLDELGGFMGEPVVPGDPGQSFVNGLVKLMEACEVRDLPMSRFGVDPKKFPEAADIVKDVVGIDFDRYELSKQDIIDMLQKSYR